MPAASACAASSSKALAVRATIGVRGRPRCGFALADALRRGVAVHHRHLAVHQHQVDRIAARCASSACTPSAASTTSMPSDCSISSRDHAVDRVVFDDEHRAAERRRRVSRPPIAESVGSVRHRRRVDLEGQREAEASSRAPGWLSTSMRPPIASTMRWLIARPRPVPPRRRLRVAVDLVERLEQALHRLGATCRCRCR